MKKHLISLLVFLFLGNLLPSTTYAQAPEGFMYQAEARNAKGVPITKATFAVKITIRSDYPGGVVVWEGEHEVTTDNYGLFSLVVSEGTGGAYKFTDIDWSNGTYFLNVMIFDCGAWVDMGTSQFLSVPYALHANTAENINETDPLYNADPASGITSGDITDWKTAFTDRFNWDGRSTGLNPVTGRTSLGLGSLSTLNRIGISESSFTNQDLKTTSSPTFNRAYISDYVYALGGIHVGGNTDPGTDNLIVDGNFSVGTNIHSNYKLYIAPGNNSTGININHDRTTSGSTYGINVDVDATYSGNKIVYGINSTANNVGGNSNTYGLYGRVEGSSTGYKYGVRGEARGNGNNFGVYGYAQGSGSNAAYAVRGMVDRSGTGYYCSGYFVGSGSGGTYGGVYADNRTGASIDIAEYILDTFDDTEPGDVVIADPSNSESIIKSTKPYDATVLGVISTQPHMVIGSELVMDEDTGEMYENVNAAQLTLVGRVPVKVTDENGPIKIGDLLTTSSKPGYAMKCDDKLKGIGAILGKALENHELGDGKIIALVTLK